MFELSILSPHRDDAIFSTFFSMATSVRAGLTLTVVNFFTRSEYGPRAMLLDGQLNAESISALRSHEDRRALLRIQAGIAIDSIGMADAPIRLGIKLDAICTPETFALRPMGESQVLAWRIRRYFTRGLVLAPLALGDHVDHRAVLDAVLFERSRPNLGFYEDLPYATWTSDHQIRQRVQEVEERTRTNLKSVVVRIENGRRMKQRAVVRYQTQISPEEAISIADYARKYGGGERLWVPRYSRRWSPVLR